MQATDFAHLWLPVHLAAVDIPDRAPDTGVGNWVSALAERARSAYDDIGQMFGPGFVPIIHGITDRNAAIIVSSIPIRARYDYLRGRDQLAVDCLTTATYIWGLAAGDALIADAIDDYQARLIRAANTARAALETPAADAAS